jgi:hypothetical protein
MMKLNLKWANLCLYVLNLILLFGNPEQNLTCGTPQG